MRTYEPRAASGNKHQICNVLVVISVIHRLQFTMDANVGAAIFKKGASLEATTASLSDPRSSYDTYSYTVSKGAIIDVSWKGMDAFSIAECSNCPTGACMRSTIVLAAFLNKLLDFSAKFLFHSVNSNHGDFKESCLHRGPPGRSRS